MNREIRSKFRIAGTTLRRYHNELLQAGQIKIIKGKRHTGYTYQIVDAESYERLKTSIANVLDDIFNKIESKRASKPVVSQSKNGSPKTQKTKKKDQVSQQS